MKKKILFYGNCQLGPIALYFRKHFSDKYEISNCENIGLVPFWKKESGVYSVWSPLNKEKQNALCAAIHSDIEKSDVFIFQDHSNLDVKELNTKYLHDNVSKNIKICVPNSRLLCYRNDTTTIQRLISYIKSERNIQNKTEIISYLKISNDPRFIDFINEVCPESSRSHKHPYVNENERKELENSKTYENCITINDFLKKEWKNKLLFISHNHPSIFYFEELIKRLLFALNEPFDIETMENFEYPMGGYNVNELNYFKEYYKNIEIPKDVIWYQNLTEKDISDKIETFV
jgi:hypothetical protein